MDRYEQRQEEVEHRRQLCLLQDIEPQPAAEQRQTERCNHQSTLQPEPIRRHSEVEQAPESVEMAAEEQEAACTAAETPSARGTANVRSRVRYWLNDIVDEMRKKSPASVQKWVDSIQMPSSAGSATINLTTDATGSPSGADVRQDEPDAHFSDEEAPTAAVTSAAVEEQGRRQQEEGNIHRRSQEEDANQKWNETVNPEDSEEQEEDVNTNKTTEHVLIQGCQQGATDSNALSVDLSEVFDGCSTTSTPKQQQQQQQQQAKLQASSKSGDGESSGLSLRSFLSKKSLLGKFSRSGSNLDHSPTATGENVPTVVGVAGSSEVLDEARLVPGPDVSPPTPNLPSPSPFVVGKSKINEFYDKLSINKAKYSLIKAKKLDIRNMLGGVALGGRDTTAAQSKANEPLGGGDMPRVQPSATVEESAKGYESGREEEVEEEATGGQQQQMVEAVQDRSGASQLPEPLEVSVIDMDPSDAYEFSFDESFPKSDELIAGMISEEDEEKENMLDTTVSSVGGSHHAYGYDAYLNPPKPKTHRIGIGRIGRSSSENPRATARRYNLMEIGRSFSEMNDDDDSFAISECNNSCPNPSSLNTSSSINEHSSAGNLTRSVPVSPIPRTSSKLSIQQDHVGQHPSVAQLQQQHSLVEQGHHGRRRSTMLVKDSSLQSDSSRCSSVESLLNARKPDPEKILLNLGFGPAPHSTDVLAKIPKRFLKPSQVRGVDTEAFLRQQQLSMHIHENSVLGYRGLVGNPHIPPSMIVAKIMERFQENDSKTRLTASGLPLPQSDSRNSSGPPSPIPMSRHASLATTDGRLKF